MLLPHEYITVSIIWDSSGMAEYVGTTLRYQRGISHFSEDGFTDVRFLMEPRQYVAVPNQIIPFFP